MLRALLTCSPLSMLLLMGAVSFMGICTLPPCLVSEYCRRGSLYDVLQAAARDPAQAAQLTWRRRVHMVSAWTH